ncbi:MAG: hypothetical protein KDJ24_06110 [Gammaproteobacteria bacterium]|nr:hypothetical protein [Gammaproteobacteria bacterium]
MPADVVDEWAFPNRATPPGSAAYYAVRFSADTRRQLNAYLLAWHALIREISDRPHDPGVARLKLDWWRQEITATAEGSPRHPLLRALSREETGTTTASAMLCVVDAAERTLQTPQPTDDLAFADACRDDQGTLFHLLASVDTDAAADASANLDAGGYCSAIARIQHVARRPDLLPADCGAEQLRTLSAGQRTERIEALLAALAPGHLAQARSSEVGMRLAALARALHEKLRRSGYAVHPELIDRAPLAKLWTAWRAAR